MSIVKRKWDVVILGGGFAGLSCARRLEKLFGAEARKRVLLISADNYFVYQPFLPEVIGAGIEPRHVMHPIRLALRRCTVHRAEVARLDLSQRRVEFDPVEGLALPPVAAEHLVLALGSRTNLRAVRGIMEHGLFLKTLADALQIREHIIKRLEEANLEGNQETRRALLHFVIIGGGTAEWKRLEKFSISCMMPGDFILILIHRNCRCPWCIWVPICFLSLEEISDILRNDHWKIGG